MTVRILAMHHYPHAGADDFALGRRGRNRGNQPYAVQLVNGSGQLRADQEKAPLTGRTRRRALYAPSPEYLRRFIVDSAF